MKSKNYGFDLVESMKKIESILNRKNLPEDLRQLRGIVDQLKSNIHPLIKKVPNYDTKVYLVRAVSRELHKQNILFLKRIEVSKQLKDLNYFNPVEGINPNNLLTCFNHIETLDGLSSILNMNLDEDSDKDNELKKHAVDILLELDKYVDDYFIEEKVDSLIDYLRVRGECAYQDVIEFIDKNYSYLCSSHECMQSLNYLIRSYSKEKVETPWYYGRGEHIKRGIWDLEDKDFVEPKSKEKFIYMVNTAFKCANDRLIPNIKDELFTEDKQVLLIKE